MGNMTQVLETTEHPSQEEIMWLAEEIGAEYADVLAVAMSVEKIMMEEGISGENGPEEIMNIALEVAGEHGISDEQVKDAFALMEAKAMEENHDEHMHHEDHHYNQWEHCLEGVCQAHDMSGEHSWDDCCENVRMHEK